MTTEPEEREDAESDTMSEEALRASMEKLSIEGQIFADEDSGVQAESDGSAAEAEVAEASASEEENLEIAETPVTNGDCSSKDAISNSLPESSPVCQENSLQEQQSELVSA